VNESLRFNTGEVELAYSEWPGEGPPVVALHGISASRAALLTRWEDGHHAYAYDHRGHGESARAPGTYTFLTFARDTVEFLRQVVSEPAILVGHSLGGMCAIYAAANAPEFVKAVFLVDPPLYAEGPRPEDDASSRELIEQRAGLPVSELLAMDIPRLRAEWLAQLDPNVIRM
jgi:pimeloyl-ACP methyl ester carboxylesterase